MIKDVKKLTNQELDDILDELTNKLQKLEASNMSDEEKRIACGSVLEKINTFADEQDLRDEIELNKIMTSEEKTRFQEKLQQRYKEYGM